MPDFRISRAGVLPNVCRSHLSILKDRATAAFSVEVGGPGTRPTVRVGTVRAVRRIITAFLHGSAR